MQNRPLVTTYTSIYSSQTLLALAAMSLLVACGKKASIENLPEKSWQAFETSINSTQSKLFSSAPMKPTITGDNTQATLTFPATKHQLLDKLLLAGQNFGYFSDTEQATVDVPELVVKVEAIDSSVARYQTPIDFSQWAVHLTGEAKALATNDANTPPTADDANASNAASETASKTTITDSKPRQMTSVKLNGVLNLLTEIDVTSKTLHKLSQNADKLSLEFNPDSQNGALPRTFSISGLSSESVISTPKNAKNAKGQSLKNMLANGNYQQVSFNFPDNELGENLSALAIDFSEVKTTLDWQNAGEGLLQVQLGKGNACSSGSGDEQLACLLQLAKDNPLGKLTSNVNVKSIAFKGQFKDSAEPQTLIEIAQPNVQFGWNEESDLIQLSWQFATGAVTLNDVNVDKLINAAENTEEVMSIKQQLVAYLPKQFSLGFKVDKIQRSSINGLNVNQSAPFELSNLLANIDLNYANALGSIKMQSELLLPEGTTTDNLPMKALQGGHRRANVQVENFDEMSKPLMELNPMVGMVVNMVKGMGKVDEKNPKILSYEIEFSAEQGLTVNGQAFAM